MRAFVLTKTGGSPGVQDFREPEVTDDEQVVVKVLAAGMNPVDRSMANNAFGQDLPLPRVVGLEGVGELPDGQRVYIGQSVTPFGTFAEQALAKTAQNVELPDDIDNGTAIALGMSGMAAWLPLQWKAKLQPGESVLILGATGVQGQLAVQAAKLQGAGHVVAAGRDQKTLELLKGSGADGIAVLEGDLAQAIKQAAPEGGYDVIIDSLFGDPFLGLLDSGTLHAKSRVVVLGGSAGQEIALRYRQLQATNGAAITGYSSFGVPADTKRAAYLAMIEHAIAGELKIDAKEYPLDKAAEAWEAQGQGPHHKIIIVP